MIAPARPKPESERDTIADAAADAAKYAETAPAEAQEFWRRLAGSLRKAATIPRK